ncbi:MAG TPA: hypothetical protein VF875_18895, partial [Anaeromyxobacter sp.]
MSRIRSTVAAFAVVSALAACGAPERGATAGTAAAEPSGPSTTATPTATPLVRTAFALEPTTSTSTASRLALSAGAEVVVDPRATFEVELAA